MTLSRQQFENVYASAHVSPSGYIRNVHVRSAERGKGHGTSLMHEIAGEADETDTTLTLNARPDLHEWYGRFGFKPTGETLFDQPTLQRKPGA